MPKKVNNPETDNTKIAVISTTLGYIQRDIAAINTTMQGLAGVYETKEEAISKGKAFDDRLVKVEASNNLWKWLGPILAAVLGSILTFLIINYLQHK